MMPFFPRGYPVPRSLALAFFLFVLAAVLAAPTTSLALGITEVGIQGAVTNEINDLTFGPQGTYSKPGFPLLLPQTSFDGDNLQHVGGSFTFGSSETATSYTYENWQFDLRNGCPAGGPECFVTQTVGLAPFKVTNVDFATSTADLTFTDSGAQEWSDLAGQPGIFSEDDLFASQVKIIPEPSSALLTALGLAGLTALRRRSGLIDPRR
jgi:hypothetical protein